MIKRIMIDDIHVISEYIWDVYQDENKRTTPPYQDAKDIETHLSKCLQYKSSHLLGVWEEDNLEGVALILVDENDQSLNVQGPYIHKSHKYRKIASELMDYIESNFKGFKCYIGTTKPNVLSQEFFKSRGFLCTDDTIQMSVTKDALVPIEPQFNIQLLSEERMEDYKDFHDNQYHDYYWLSDRIYGVMDRWKVHIALENNKIIGSIFTMKQTEDSGEIYGCKVLDPYKNKQVLAELFYISTKSWMDENLTKIFNFVPEGLESESAALVGYKGYDTYMCFFKGKV
ncbi:GNAT family N-acetyltransferase [Tissierella sp.]|uniref:GNAT family N-acetyltransferase n=1 Tax=Tissierella sp. TaxID=41274 RepID=UPI002859EE56|nr:GNAT family N-acetyltransferase [Tissierella sp.]MDR7856597.1 GNAT family N-acetyltransferase [Tissierella sp.]